MISLGLDISSTSSGAVLLDGERNQQSKVLLQEVWAPPAKLKLDYLDRGSWQAERLLALLEKFTPGEICIEGYSLNSKFGQESLITVGTVIRYFLRQSGYRWHEVAPTRLKKYMGAGTKKEDMKLAVYKRYGFEHASNDVVDGYALAQIGLGIHSCAFKDLTVPQAEVVSALCAPPVIKKSRKTT